MPRNILALPGKKSVSLSTRLSHAIRAYISENYTDTHPDAFARDIQDFVRVRDAATRLEVHVSSIDAALNYHAQLVFFSSKFPPNIGIAFPWSITFPPSLPLWTSGVSATTLDADADPSASAASYATSDTVAHPDLLYERANLLVSLASLYSNLGASEGRAESESIKRSISYFQSAAGVLQHVHDTLIPEIRHLKPPSPDLSPSLLQCLRDLMLAQAQECFWQKAVLDRLKDNTIAKLAQRVSELYESALELATASDDNAKPHIPTDWINHITVKRWHFAAAAQYRKSSDDLASNRYGDELGRLKLAEAHVKKALDSSRRGSSEAIVNDLKSLQQIIATNIQRGTKDNDLIYLEPVTPASHLPAIVAASMVKPVVPPDVANSSPLLRGKPLFAELVPYGVHLAISIYDDRKDSIVRQDVAERRDELDGIATSTLQSLNLPGSLQALEQPMGLPPSLLRRHEEVVAEGGISRLHSIAEDVARIAHTDADILAEAVSILDQEAREDEQMRASFSSERWPRPPSTEAAAELRAQAQRYADTLRQAASSDIVVRQKLDDWDDLIGVLSRGVEDLEAFVPSSTSAVGASSSAQLAAVRALRSELESLDDLLDARATCLAEARALASSDDVRPLVLAQVDAVDAADFEPLFEAQLRKYDKFRREMDRSAAAQDELLERIGARNAEFIEARKVDTELKRREKALQNLDVAYAKYRELASNLVEGLEFYNGLAKLLSAFRQDVKEWARARQIDVAHLTAQFAGTSLQHQHGSKRVTRAQAKAQPQPQPQPQPQQQQQQNEAPNPQWGAFPGGEIRFAD